MANLTLNGFIKRIRGQFGEIVVKQMNGRQFLAEPPDRSNVPPATASQLAMRQAFVLAAAYAKGALRTQRAFYERAAAVKQLPLFSVALADYLKPPVVGLVDLSAYKGRAGDKVTILATDDVEVVSVDVVIRAADGAVIEQGPAENVDGPWGYTATTTLAAGQSVTFEVTARDRPNHEGGQSIPYTMPA